jgi:predicted MFS family arabinose efflux permease
MLAFGWRAMFVSVGLFSLLLSLAWYPLYRDRERVTLTRAEADSLGLEKSSRGHKCPCANGGGCFACAPFGA